MSYGIYWGGYFQGKFSGDYRLKGPVTLAEAKGRTLLVSDMKAFAQTQYLSNHRGSEGMYTPIGGMWAIRGNMQDVLPPSCENINYNYGLGDGHVETIRGAELVNTTVMDIANIRIYLPSFAMIEKNR